MVEIKQKLINPNKYSLKCPYFMNPEFLVVHNTYNDASAENEITYMINNDSSKSFHYAVDDKCIIQGIPEDRNAFHAGDGRYGDGNRKGIGIEICYSLSGGPKFIQAEKNAAEFCAYKLKERGWGIEKITKHQDYSDKYCPHRTLDMGWDRFIKMVQSYMGTDSPFIDVNVSHWAYKSIKNLYSKNIISGYDDGTFRPDDYISRAEAASIIYNECNFINPINIHVNFTKKFPDVSETHWAYDDITNLYNIGIVNGFNDGTYKPENNMSRAEFAIMLRNSIDAFSKYTGKWSKTFTDVDETHWAYRHINDLYNMGIVTGKKSGMFMPKDTITRAEVSVMINNLLKFYNK